MPAWVLGDTTIRVSTVAGARSPAMMMATGFVKCMCIPWKGCGRYGAVGFVRIGALPKQNSPLSLGFFAFVHNVRQRGKVLLPARIALLVRQTLASTMRVRQRSLGSWRSRTGQRRASAEPAFADEPAGQLGMRGVYASQRLSFLMSRKTSRGKPRSAPYAGNPTGRDQRGPAETWTHVARAAGLTRPRYAPETLSDSHASLILRRSATWHGRAPTGRTHRTLHGACLCRACEVSGCQTQVA